MASPELESDLLELFDGVDTQELLSDDPALELIAKELSNYHSLLEDYDDEDPLLFPEPNFALASTKYISSPNSVDSSDRSSESGSEGEDGKDGKLTCSACGGPSKGIKYLGAQVCMSCRAFFVRSLKDQAYKKFVCLKGSSGLNTKTCQINSKSWKSCKRCRFRLCLQAGMTRPDLSKISEDNNGDKANRKVDVNERIWQMLRSQMDKMVRGRIKCALSHTTGMTLEEEAQLYAFPNLYVDFAVKVYSNIARRDATHFQLVMDFLFQGNLHPMYIKKDVIDYERYCATELFLKQSGYPWDCVKRSDLIKLVSKNSPLLLEYMTANRMGKRHCNKKEVANLIYIMSNDPDEAFSSKVKSAFLQVMLLFTVLIM